MRLLTLFLVTIAAGGSCCAGEAKIENEVLQVVRTYEKAVNTADPILWLSIWDLKYEGLTILENDKPPILGRKYVEQIAEGLKRARPDNRQTWHTTQVFLLGPDLAYIVSLRTEHNLPADQKESRVSLLVRRSADGWKIVHAHFSFVPK